MINPYVILAIVLAWVCSLAGVGYWQHDAGIASQKITDQVQFDKINQERTDEKAQANAIYRHAQDDNLALATERDQLKTNLEKEHAINQKRTADLADTYARVRLQFNAPGAGHRDGGGSTEGTNANTTSAASATVVQLPDQITSDLRQLVIDADNLKDNYTECYGYANKVK